MLSDPSEVISTEEPPKRYRTVLERSMAYTETGSGSPVVFLHGNPASSYIWRNIIPHVSSLGRCIAPDLIGMGDSDKIEGDDPERYSFLAHRRFLDQFLVELGVTDDVVLVGQDWGGAFALDWARRHPGRTRGVVYFETFVRPRTWEEMDPAVRHIFKRLRSPEGEDMVLRDNIFIEQMFADRILRPLSQVEMEVYRRPYLRAGEDRRPTLTFPRELAVNGEPVAMVDVITAYAKAMAAPEIPKLFINGEPGAILTGALRDFCRTWQNQEEVTVRGKHFLQEDSPHEIGSAIARWLGQVPTKTTRAA